MPKREAESLSVVRVRVLLVDVVATKGLVLQVLHRLPAQVGNPRGGAEMVGVVEIGELGRRVRPCHGIQRVKPVAVNPQGIRCHHAAQQRVTLPALVSQHVAINNRLANVGQAAVAYGRSEALRAGKVVLGVARGRGGEVRRGIKCRLVQRDIGLTCLATTSMVAIARQLESTLALCVIHVVGRVAARRVINHAQHAVPFVPHQVALAAALAVLCKV